MDLSSPQSHYSNKIIVALFLFLLCFVLFGLLFHPLPAQAAVTWQIKVDPWVLAQAQKGETDFILFLNQQADLSAAATMSTKNEKAWYVYQQLTAVAKRSQTALIQTLRNRGWKYQPYWVANMILVHGDSTALQYLASRSDVSHIYANPMVKQDLPQPLNPSGILATEGLEWNIAKVNANLVWDYGFRGQGAVIAGQDTGYDWEHPALKNAYRGWNGSRAEHDYNWHDAIHVSNSRCPGDSPIPCDDYGHGTHTMGTMVGEDGVNQIGMAPAAKWIGCRNMNFGVGSPATYTECFQFFLAPTKLDGSDPLPDLAPDVINNSWSCPVSEGCSDPNVLHTVVENVRAAGILTIQSAGNNGPNCSSITDPAGIYQASFTVGATDSADVIAPFSNRGPVTVDGSNRTKPDISAPGVGIRSSLPHNGYGTMSGTSMAAPHVAGLAVLLISADPTLQGDPDRIQNVIESGAIPRTTTQSCGSISGTSIPNNTYGYGRIDALASLGKVYPLYWYYFPFVPNQKP